MKATRSLGLLVAAGMALVLGCDGGSGPPEAAETAARPPERNVLLISIDTLRADALGAYRPGLATSPHLDALAARGVLFEQVATSSPSTLPSHASILTGLQPYAHGVRSNAGYRLAASSRTLAEAFAQAGYRTAAEVATVVLGRGTGIEQGFESFRDVASATLGGRGTARERRAQDISDAGIRFLESVRQQAFFLWLHYYDPHVEYAAPPEFAERFPDMPYHAEVAYTDDAVGRLLGALDRLGLADRTLVVVTSDHGEGLGEHGEQTHAYLVYDTTMRVPLILAGPDMPPGLRVPALVRSIDIAPTLLEWAGLPALPGTQGRALRPPLRRAGPEVPRLAYGESLEAHRNLGASPVRFVRNGAWKYIHKTRPELYDVLRDPGERSDRFAEEPARVDALRGQLERLLLEAPSPPGDAAAPLDAARAAQLAALGYLDGGQATSIDDERASLEISGPDPNDVVGDLHLLSEAKGLLWLRRDYAGAAEILAALAKRHPEGRDILAAWFESLRGLGREDEALEVLGRAVAASPGNRRLRLELIRLLRDRGALVPAERHARDAFAREPCGDLELAYLAGLMRAQGRYAEQLQTLERGVRDCGGDAQRNELAYLLATSPVAAQRDGPRALALAQQITRGEGGARPEFVDTLAAAYAETGDFARAVTIQREALAMLARSQVPEATMAVFREHLRLFESGRPLRDE